jgi:hypothetical protein
VKIKVEFTEEDFRRALREMVERDFQVSLPAGIWKLNIETKSKQNYRSEWENAAYRGTFEAEDLP